jgi:glycosyltransferase involved in cell wall biosynthesis
MGLLKKNKGTGGYYGSGWIASLQKLILEKSVDIDLGIVFPSSEKENVVKSEKTTYFPVYKPTKSFFQKLKYYYAGYKKNRQNQFVQEILNIVDDFKPDIIHLFGMENEFATILGKTNVPVVVHLQGLLAPYDNAFWPVGFNAFSFVLPPSIREWILRNGYIFAKKSISIRGKRESGLFKKVRYCMGRTEWDFQVSQLLSPESQYFKVNEALRTDFYENSDCWKREKKEKLIIVSTISETIYKGLDLILKTAKLLKEETSIDFEWKIIGVTKQSKFTMFFEHFLNINSESVGISYLGVKNPKEIVSVMKDSSVYVHPSYIDNSPNSVCEAQLLGLPVIACNVGGLSTILDYGNAGVLVPANAPYELAYHLKQFAVDEMYCEDKRIAGVKLAKERHNPQEIIRDLMTAYRNVIETSKLHLTV